MFGLAGLEGVGVLDAALVGSDAENISVSQM